MKRKFTAPLLACCLTMLSGLAVAQSYPAKGIRIIVPFATGGGTDLMTRITAEEMSKAYNVPVIVDNVPGAGGTIGARQAARAAADGYTLMSGTPGTIVINPHLMAEPGYDSIRDFVAITQISGSPGFLIVNKDFPATSVQALINMARKDPGSINYASAGIGSFLHLSGELFASLAKVTLTHVPYKGTSPALTDLAAGRVQVMFNLVQPDDPFVKSGAVKLIAIGILSPSPAFPSLPTIAATVPGYETSTWLGLFAPTGAPQTVIDRVYRTVSAAVKQPATRARLTVAGGGEPVGSSPAEFTSFVASKHREMGELVKITNMPKQ